MMRVDRYDSSSLKPRNLMRLKSCAALLAVSLWPFTAHADAAADENSVLRAEIAALKARNEILQQSCPVAATPAMPAALSATSSSAAKESTPVAAPAATVTHARVAPITAEVAAPAKPYTHTGCDQGLFSGPPPGKWRDAKAWNTISKGMTMTDVENGIGVEHYDVQKSAKIQWQYGRCGNSWEGSVTFADGLVVSVSPPGSD